MAEPLNDVIDALKPLFDKISTVIQGYKDEAEMQKERADALEAAAQALDASGNVVDGSHADTLRGFNNALTPLVTQTESVIDPNPQTSGQAAGSQVPSNTSPALL